MKAEIIILSMAVLLSSGQVFTHAEEGQGEHKGSIEDSMKSGDFSEDAVEVGNKICPVSSKDVWSMGQPQKYEYKGKIYNLCCKMCLKSFKKDPEKYSKIAQEGIKEEEGQHK